MSNFETPGGMGCSEYIQNTWEFKLSDLVLSYTAKEN